MKLYILLSLSTSESISALSTMLFLFNVTARLGKTRALLSVSDKLNADFLSRRDNFLFFPLLNSFSSHSPSEQESSFSKSSKEIFTFFLKNAKMDYCIDDPFIIIKGERSENTKHKVNIGSYISEFIVKMRTRSTYLFRI